MKLLSDSQLLRAFAERHSEEAFAELVRRHIDFVHSVAFRMVNDAHLAKDVTQAVLVELMGNAGKLGSHPVLCGWLHRTARNIAAKMVRADARRRRREQDASILHPSPEMEAPREELSPYLDAALGVLTDADRDAVLLRYFENKSAREMAAVLGITAETAQKRVNRAVDKLRLSLAGRGITASSAGLAAAISANAVQAAPAGLAATVSVPALLGTAALTTTTTQILAMTTLQKSLVTAVITVLAGFGIYQTARISRLEEQVRASLSGEAAPSVAKGQPRRTVEENTTGLVRNNQRLIGKNSDLVQRNEELEEENARTKAELEINARQAEYLADITGKFARGDELPVPQTVSELAVFYVQVHRRSRDFYQKWNGRVPAEGTPEAAEYRKDLDTSVTEDAALLKALQTVEGGIDDPAGLGAFQSMALYGSLGLDEAAYGRVCEVLGRFYAEFDRRKMSSRFRPERDVEAWDEMRNQAARKAIDELRSCFTPQQQADFERLYTPEFLWGLNVGYQRPK